MTRSKRQSPLQKALTHCRTGEDQKGLVKIFIDSGIGYGVFTTQRFKAGEFLLVYPGEIISSEEGEKRHKNYTDRDGSYLYFYQQYCIDATLSTRLGKYVNDSYVAKNCLMKPVADGKKTYLCLFVLPDRDIEMGTELRYSYIDIPTDEDNLFWRQNKETAYPRYMYYDQIQKKFKIVDEEKPKKKKHLPASEVISYLNKEMKVVEHGCGNECDAAKSQVLGSHKDALDYETTEVCDTAETKIVNFDDAKSAMTNEEIPSSDADSNDGCNEETWILSHGLPTLEDCADKKQLKKHTQFQDIKFQLYPVLDDRDDDIDLTVSTPNRKFVSTTAIDATVTTKNESQEHNDSSLKLFSTPLSPIAEVVNQERSAGHDVNEVVILNDTGIGLGDSMGEVVNTSDDMDFEDLAEERSEKEFGENELLAPLGKKLIKKTSKHDQQPQVDNTKKKKMKKPSRPCPYCHSFQRDLTRHLKLRHKDESAVKIALSKSTHERIRAFADLRKQGIFSYNIKQMESEKPTYLRERRPADDTDQEVMVCISCKGVYAKKFKSRHQIECGKNSGQVMAPLISIKTLVTLGDYKDDFMAVVNKMNLDDVSSLIKADPVILMIGNRMYNGEKCKEEKKNEVEKKVRSTMRLLSRLFIHFKENFQEAIESSKMFDKNNLKFLIEAIEKLSDKEVGMKCGLKVQLQNVIKQSAKILEAHYLVSGDDQAEVVSQFLKVLALVEHEVFGGALYQLKQKRNKMTRKPANMPADNLVDELMEHIKKVTHSDNIVFKFPSNIFCEVRDAACGRLTIFNGRRGGEPARLFIYQWKEALDGEWLRPHVREEYKKEIDSGNRITYQEGKGDKLVPVFIPPDQISALTFLCNEESRRSADVNVKNDYVFPSTKQSLNHVSGWHSLMSTCKKSDIILKINGTINRHRVSSLIGALGLPEHEQELAFQHLGHSGDINRNIYQAPPAERQLASTGRYLAMIDKQKIPNQQSDLHASRINTGETKKPNVEMRVKDSRVGTDKNCTKHAKVPDALIQNSEMTKNFTCMNKYTLRRKDRRIPLKDDEVEGGDVNGSDDEDEDFDIAGDHSFNESTDESFEEEKEEKTVKTPKMQKLEGRTYFVWRPDQIERFESTFRDILQKDSGYPSRSEFEEFSTSSGIPISNIRTRIMNTRKRRKEMKKKNMVLLGL